MHSSQVTLPLPDGIDLALFCGPQDANLRAIEDLFDATIALRSDSIVMTGDALEVPLISALVSDLFDMVQADKAPTVEDIRRAVEVLRNSDYSPSSLREDILLTYRGRAIRPKTSGQKRYCDAIRDSTVTFAIGPAGTGKQGDRSHHPYASRRRGGREPRFLAGYARREGRSLCTSPL